MQIVRKIHSLQYFGFWQAVVEIVAGWAIVLALSGIFLWWPRGKSGGALTVRGTPKIRMFWRDLHAVTGLFTSSLIVFLAVIGMPWSQVWGKYVHHRGWSWPASPAPWGRSRLAVWTEEERRPCPRQRETEPGEFALGVRTICSTLNLPLWQKTQSMPIRRLPFLTPWASRSRLASPCRLGQRGLIRRPRARRARRTRGSFILTNIPARFWAILGFSQYGPMG